jgi:cytochrome c
MKEITICLIGFAFLTLFYSNILASSGEEIFYKLNCSACHRQEKSGFAPSIKEISKFYKEKKERLIKYLKGEAEAIVDPERQDYMKPYIRQIKKLKDSEIEKLADYLISF